MLRMAVFAVALGVPGAALAQQPCTTDARYVVDQTYRAVLERGADRGAASQISRLQAGTATVRDIVRELAQSREHTSQSGRRGDPAGDEQTVRRLYRHVLGRDADPGGLEAHTRGLNTEGPAAVIDSMLNSPEYQQKFGDYGVPGSTGLRYCGRTAGAVGSTGNDIDAAVDANRDGRIDRWEWKGTWREFDARDSNGDNILSSNELGATGTSGLQDGRFSRVDLNGDGRIERNEWNGTRREFNRLDANRDGVLQYQEVTGAVDDATPTFSSLDRNRDNRITFDEWNWNRRSFNQQDSNRDGVIAPREFTGAPIRQRP
jgi:hypothetical protein